MKLKYKFFILPFTAILIGCGSTDKMASADEKSAVLDKMMADKSFKIESDWAMPLLTTSLNSVLTAGLLPPGNTPNRISLIGNPNYLKVEADTISAYLPYFGERQMNGGYNNRGTAIQFKGVPEDLKINKDDKKQRQEMRFNIKDKTEVYQVNIVLFPNLTSTINVNSSQRFSIRYSGRVEAVSGE